MSSLIKLVGSILLFLFCVQSICGQRYSRNKDFKRFSTGIILGSSFSQIHGDRYSGFDRQSIMGGIMIESYLSSHLRLHVNFNLLGKGSTIETHNNRPNIVFPKDRFIHLLYAEVPILLRVSTKANSGFYFETGFSLNKMINSKIVEDVNIPDAFIFSDIQKEFNTNEASFILGLGKRFGDDFSIGFRSSISFNNFYSDDSELPMFSEPGDKKNVLYLRNYYISFYGGFHIF